MMRFVMALAFALSLAEATARGSGAAMAVPDIGLVNEAGSTVRLPDLRGQVVLLDFWASWCIPCRTSFPAIDALQKELHDRGFTALAINVDEERKSADAFLARRPHTLTVVFDPQGRAAAAFRLQGMPSTVLLDREGTVRVTHMGYTEKTIAQYRAEILALLGE